MVSDLASPVGLEVGHDGCEVAAVGGGELVQVAVEQLAARSLEVLDERIVPLQRNLPALVPIGGGKGRNGTAESPGLSFQPPAATVGVDLKGEAADKTIHLKDTDNGILSTP